MRRVSGWHPSPAGCRTSWPISWSPCPSIRPLTPSLSTATFHWVTDHDRLFRNLAAIVRPGGRLVAQCGGAGNVDSVLNAADEVGGAWQSPVRPWIFATPEETADRLRAAGF